MVAVALFGTLGNGAVPPAAAAAAGFENALPVAGELFEFDAAVQADLDALLADPVELDTGADLDRLRGLPWLDAAALEALAGALPVEDLAALARVPPWDEQRVRMLEPFVQAAAGPGRRTPARWRFAATARPDALTAHTERGGWRATARHEVTRPAAIRAAVAWMGSHGGVAAGGLRATHGLGLVLGPQAWGPDAGAAIAPAPATAQMTSARAPWLRGIAAHTAHDRMCVYAGRGGDGPLQAASLAWGRPGARLGAIAVHSASAWRAGLFAHAGTALEWAAVEAARGPEGPAFAIAAAHDDGACQLAARVDARPAGWNRTGGAAPALPAGAAQARARWRRGRAALSARAAQGWETQPDGERRTASVQTVDADLATRDWVVEATWTVRRFGAEEIAGMDIVQTARDRGQWELRAVRTRAGQSLGFDARAWRDASTDRAWQAHYGLGRTARRLVVAVAGFNAARSRSIALPFGGTGADSRVRGNGLRFAAGAEGAARGIEIRAAAAAVAAHRVWHVQVHAALGLRFR